MIVRYENNQQGAAKVQVKYPGSNFGTMAGNKKRERSGIGLFQGLTSIRE